MCAATRFPEAIPLSNIRTPAICEALKVYFSKFGRKIDKERSRIEFPIEPV